MQISRSPWSTQHLREKDQVSILQFCNFAIAATEADMSFYNNYKILN